MSAVSPDPSVRLVSWNIHGAIGTDGLCRPERIAQILRETGADIVALQEVDGRTHLRRRPHAFETMAELLGEGEVVEARLFGRPGREHGNLLWSRRPIGHRAVHLLPGGLEQRGAIEARIETAIGPLTVFATHLGLSPITRRAQAAELARLAGAVAHGPVALVGDLNEWHPRGPVHRRLTRVLPVALKPATYPSRRPFARLDRLYASADLVATLPECPPQACAASDHLPLVVDLIVEARD